MSDQVKEYLAELRSALSGTTLPEREEILEEIRTHILDRVKESGLTASEVLDRLGPASELAQDYGTGALVRRASRSLSPWTILRSTYYWSKTGIQGFAVFSLRFAAI